MSPNNGKPEEYNLRLVRQLPSVLVFVLFVMGFLFLSIFTVVKLDLSKFASMTLLISTFGILGVFMYFQFDKILIHYSRSIVITEEFFEYQNRRYAWTEITWYRDDTGSAIMKGFSVGIKNAKSLHFMVKNKSSKEQDIWEDMRRHFLEILISKDHRVRNYYDSPFWRGLAHSLLISNFLIPLILVICGFDFVKIVPSFLVWIGTSITFSMMVYMNQKPKKITLT